MLIIDNEFRNLISPLTKEEFEQLENNIIAEGGIHDPIIIWNNIIIDGHNRYDICIKNDLKYFTKELELTDRNQAINWIIDNQLGRRNLAPWQMSILRGKRYNAEKKNIPNPKGINQHNEVKYQNDTKPLTRDMLASQYGVSPATIARDGNFAIAAEKASEIEDLPVMQLTKEQILNVAKEIKREKREAALQNKVEKIPQPFPTGKYSVIYTDPPWPVGSITMDKWESPIDDKYPVMSIEDIINLPVTNLAADDCALFMWTTHTFLPDALNIINEWGFKYFCCITWNKGSGWTQNGFHKMTELLLYAYKGKMNVDQYGKAIPTLIEEKKTYHSKKPDSIRDLIASKTPEPRIEMFARDSFEGWSTWGNEVNNG